DVGHAEAFAVLEGGQVPARVPFPGAVELEDGSRRRRPVQLQAGSTQRVEQSAVGEELQARSDLKRRAGGPFRGGERVKRERGEQRNESGCAKRHADLLPDIENISGVPAGSIDGMSPFEPPLAHQSSGTVPPSCQANR